MEVGESVMVDCCLMDAVTFCSKGSNKRSSGGVGSVCCECGVLAFDERFYNIGCLLEPSGFIPTYFS